MATIDEELAERLHDQAHQLPVTQLLPSGLITQAIAQRTRRARLRTATTTVLGTAVVVAGVSGALALHDRDHRHSQEATPSIYVLSVERNGASLELPPGWTITRDPCTAQTNYAYYATGSYLAKRCPDTRPKPSSISQIGVYHYQGEFVQDLRSRLANSYTVNATQVQRSDYRCNQRGTACSTELAVPASNVIFDIEISGADASDVSRSVVQSLKIDGESSR